jgi:hypothetical protein
MTKTTTTKTRNRRKPADLLADLKAQRQAIAAAGLAKLAKLDAKIAKVEARYSKSIALAELAGCSSEELVNELATAKRKQQLLRTALKAKR